jgi:hypothetical protein
MKLRRPTVQQQIISVICAGERREFVMADWPEGEPLPIEERYPLIVVDQHRDHFQEVLYSVEALEVAMRNGIKHVRAHCISDADRFPPRGQRHPPAD